MRRILIVAPALLFVLASASVSQAQTLNQNIVTFLNGKVGTRVGSGAYALATEALRVADAEFISSDLGADSPSAGDYVWGTLVKTVSVTSGVRTDSAPTAAVQPGDIFSTAARRSRTAPIRGRRPSTRRSSRWSTSQDSQRKFSSRTSTASAR